MPMLGRKGLIVPVRVKLARKQKERGPISSCFAGFIAASRVPCSHKGISDTNIFQF